MQLVTESTFTPRWSSLLFRAIASILFGIVAIAWPGVTLGALTLLFGAYAFADGVIALVVATQRGPRPHRWLLVVDGLLGLGAGVATLLWPGLTLLALVLLVGARFVITGAFQLAAAFTLRREIRSPVLYGLAGVASMIVGILTFVVPGITALVLVTMLAVYALVFGGVMLALALQMRRTTHRVPVHAPA